MSSLRQIQNFRVQAKTAYFNNQRIAFFDVKNNRFMDDIKIWELESEGFRIKSKGKLKSILFQNLLLLEVV